jgi:hypothetical protein
LLKPQMSNGAQGSLNDKRNEDCFYNFPTNNHTFHVTIIVEKFVIKRNKKIFKELI